MPFNLDSNITKDNVSLGPGVVFIGATGATPSTGVGAIDDGGVELEIASERTELRQGNPQTLEVAFANAQDVMVRFTSVEWDFSNLARALGAGATTSGAGEDTFAFGGDPCIEEYAVRIRHEMCRSGHTLYANVWKAVSDGGLSVSMGQDIHGFEHAYKAIRSATNWAGGSLSKKQQLVQLVRETA